MYSPNRIVVMGASFADVMGGEFIAPSEKSAASSDVEAKAHTLARLTHAVIKNGLECYTKSSNYHSRGFHYTPSWAKRVVAEVIGPSLGNSAGINTIWARGLDLRMPDHDGLSLSIAEEGPEILVLNRSWVGVADERIDVRLPKLAETRELITVAAQTFFDLAAVQVGSA